MTIPAWCRPLIGTAAMLLILALAGCGSGDSGPSKKTLHELAAAKSEYQAHLKENSEKLTHWADTIVLKVAEGSAPKAASRYAASRVPYGHVDPVAELQGGEPRGFAPIEKAIFGEERTAGMTPTARQLRIEVEALERRIAAAPLRPAELLEGANAVLRKIVDEEIPAKTERFCKCNLVDVAAQLEGVDASFEAVEPMLKEENPELAAKIEKQFGKAFAEVGEYGILAREPEQSRPREPGIAFVVYSELSPEAIQEVAEPIEALAQLLVEAEDQLPDS